MPAAASTLGQLVTTIQSYTQQMSSQAGYMRKIFTALAILFGILWMWRRIEHARQAERRGRQLRDAHGNIMPPNIALGQHMPSPLPPPHSSAAAAASSTSAEIDVRHLSTSDRYLTDRGSRVRRQSVCITITPGISHVFQTPTLIESASSLETKTTAPLALRDAIVPILMSLAQHTVLHLICMEGDKARQEAVIAALNSCELFSLGLQRHRILFCTTLKGKSAIIRHIEPNLAIDENREMLLQLKPFIDSVALINPSAPIDTKAPVPSYPDLTSFFLPGSVAPPSL